MSVLVCLLLLQTMAQTQANWVFEVRLMLYSNIEGRAIDNEIIGCCDAPLLCNTDPCDTRFEFTLQPLTCNSTNCAYGNFATGVVGGNSFPFPPTLPPGISNPLIFRGGIWPESGLEVNFTANVYDRDELITLDDFIDSVVVTDTFTGPQSDFIPARSVSGLHNITTITLSYRVSCAKNYCGMRCSEICPSASSMTSVSVTLATSTVLVTPGATSGPAADDRILIGAAVGSALVLVVASLTAAIVVAVAVVIWRRIRQHKDKGQQQTVEALPYYNARDNQSADRQVLPAVNGERILLTIGPVENRETGTGNDRPLPMTPIHEAPVQQFRECISLQDCEAYGVNN